MTLFNPDAALSNESKFSYESSFRFLERSSWNRCTLMRTILEEWIIPMRDDAEFLSQIRSDKDKQYYAAIFELIVFIMLKKVGYNVAKHPELDRKTTPDFEAIDILEQKIFFECTLSGNSFETMDEERRKAAVEAIIRNIEYYPYFINIDFKQSSKASISKKALLNFIDKVKDASEGYSNEALFHRRYLFENNGWQLEVSLLRKSNLTIKVSLGAVGQDAKMIDGTKSILTALNDKKPSKYGIENQPYVICLCNNDMFFHQEDMHEVLFGTSNESFINLSYATKIGFFYYNNAPINTSVSAIILFKSTDILILGSSKWSVWHNPFAKYPLATEQFPFDEFYYERDQQYLHKKSIIKEYSIFDLLSINEELYNTNPKGIDD